ncbi:MAG: hypothetical protein OK436_05480 [Thaumarchaeota archaeon]|nr:hypothetical protein [Nitrososphaerota archaeon]
MIGSVLSNVPPGTADTLSYFMLVVVAMFLLSGPAITYYYWKKNKKMKMVTPAGNT